MNIDPGTIIANVKQQYERFPYPVGEQSLDEFITSGARQAGCPSLFFNWYWPFRPKTDNLDILIAGCGTSQAAKFAVNLPEARITAIDISERSIEHTRMLMAKHGITNIDLRLLSIEQAGHLEKDFDLIISTGVLHHLADPAVGMTELRKLLRRDGSFYVMLYGKYGRDGVYYLQDLLRRLGMTANNVSDFDLQTVVSLLNALPPYHSFAAKRMFFQRNMSSAVELVDLFLHPQDKGYSIPDIYLLLDQCGLKMQKLVFRAHYDPRCSALRNSAAYARVRALPSEEQFAIGELFRAGSLMHFFIACPQEREQKSYVADIEADNWEELIPLRYPAVGIRANPGTPEGHGVLYSPHHQFPDIQFALGPREMTFFNRINGERSISGIVSDSGWSLADRATLEWVRELLKDLSAYDYVSFRG